MKIFIKDGKTNFVDDNNVFVGWDDQSICCCEYAGWFFSYSSCENAWREWHDKDMVKPEKLEGYCFDTEFGFKEAVFRDIDEGGVVVVAREADQYVAGQDPDRDDRQHHQAELEVIGLDAAEQDKRHQLQ